ncbi:WW domain-containing adapter protein with coiled-coil-like isoform X2 [Lampris incognitus]|uniref:WW domain-containing adapter protein with coiled-coil-like isoform X2 n=1 Tax=Lampris incognitus TaxID=2546036 RepID=UPI0024B5569D|nr:WW domain-containing adapter protein with coiled-coil-like isoform X2 [Lampris incognitus]
MVMHARKPTRVSDGCNDRRDSQSYQTHKSQPKSQSSSLLRYDKVRDGSSDPTPPYKILRRSDESPVNRHGDGAGHGKAKTSSHTLRGKNGTTDSPQENSHNSSSQHSSDSHSTQSKPADRRQDPADDWTEHISSSGKRYYYNCRTEVSQWEKPKDLLERERQKDSAKMAANSFPKDMDYRQEALQDKATSKSTSGDQSTASNSSHSISSSSVSQSLNSVSGASGSTPSITSSSSVLVPPAAQSQATALLQDPALLHQLLPALQATLQMNNGSMDMAKINEAAQQSSQSPVSLTSDASPRPYVSPRNGTPQTSLMSQKSLQGMTPGIIGSSQTRGNVSSGKPGPILLSQISVEKRPEDPRTHQQRSQEIPSPGQNHISGAGGAGLPASSSTTNQSQAGTPGSFTPSLAAHFDENLIRHVQGWPGEHTEKQAARLREDLHNMGNLYMSEICTELKNLRSLVRVCEIQATLREQRILFLRQQSKELDKLKNQNSYMV